MMEEEVTRVRLPKANQVIGLVEEMLGGDKLRIACEDGKTRICRIPGRLRKRVWFKPGYLVLVELWKVQNDTRGDVIWKYTPPQADWLKKNYIKTLKI